MTPKKFLFLTSHYYPHVYGAELFAQKLAEYLIQHGHSVDVVTGWWNRKLRSVENVQGVNVYRVKSPRIRYLTNLIYLWPLLRKAESLSAKNNYDFVHAHVFPALIIPPHLNTNAEKIVTIQGGDLGDYPEIYGPFAPIARKIIASSLKKYAYIHAVSVDLKKIIRTLANKEAIVIPNGIELPPKNIATNDSYFPKTKFRLFSPSRLTDKNNLIETVKAIHILREKNLDCGLLIAGQGHLEAKLNQLIADLRLKKAVKIVSYIDHERLYETMKAADAVIRVSTEEGFGIALLEGMAAKVPVIASKAGGLADFVSELNAWIPEKGDGRHIASTIETVMGNKKIAEEKSNTAFELVKSKYLWSSVCDTFAHTMYRI